MADISRLCERMLIIDRGKLLYDGGVGEIAERYGGERRLVVDLDEDVARDDIRAPELIARITSRYRIRDLMLEESDIEQVVRRIYQEGLP